MKLNYENFMKIPDKQKFIIFNHTNRLKEFQVLVINCFKFCYKFKEFIVLYLILMDFFILVYVLNIPTNFLIEFSSFFIDNFPVLLIVTLVQFFILFFISMCIILPYFAYMIFDFMYIKVKSKLYEHNAKTETIEIIMYLFFLTTVSFLIVCMATSSNCISIPMIHPWINIMLTWIILISLLSLIWVKFNKFTYRFLFVALIWTILFIVMCKSYQYPFILSAVLTAVMLSTIMLVTVFSVSKNSTNNDNIKYYILLFI